MISEQTIQQAARFLGEAAKPAKVILFGSYARGDALEDSDLDFLVIERDLHDKFHEMVRLRQVLRPLRVPVDVLAVRRQLSWPVGSSSRQFTNIKYSSWRINENGSNQGTTKVPS